MPEIPSSVKRPFVEMLPLQTERLVIQQFTKQHVTDQYVAWLNDPEVVKYSQQRLVHHTIASCLEYFQLYENTPNLFLAITEHSDRREHIGNMSVRFQIHDGVADISILIGERSRWGLGYGTEAWSAVCAALIDSGVRKVTGGTLSTNVAMQTVMQRAGMVPDGRRPKHTMVDGEAVDVVYLAYFRRAAE